MEAIASLWPSYHVSIVYELVRVLVRVTKHAALAIAVDHSNVPVRLGDLAWGEAVDSDLVIATAARAVVSIGDEVPLVMSALEARQHGVGILVGDCCLSRLHLLVLYELVVELSTSTRMGHLVVVGVVPSVLGLVALDLLELLVVKHNHPILSVAHLVIAHEDNVALVEPGVVGAAVRSLLVIVVSLHGLTVPLIRCRVVEASGATAD